MSNNSEDIQKLLVTVSSCDQILASCSELWAAEIVEDDSKCELIEIADDKCGRYQYRAETLQRCQLNCAATEPCKISQIHPKQWRKLDTNFPSSSAGKYTCTGLVHATRYTKQRASMIGLLALTDS